MDDRCQILRLHAVIALHLHQIDAFGIAKLPVNAFGLSKIVPAALDIKEVVCCGTD